MKSSFISQQYDPVAEREMQTIGQTLLPERVIGKPCAKHVISTLDIAALVVVMIFFIAAVAAVWVSRWAVLLGQTNQLVVLGFALTVMGFCANRQIILASLHLEGRYGRSTLQNFDALLRSTPYARNMSISPRMILLALQILPLGLSVAYKRFSGGQSSVSVALQDSDWGFVPPPGWTTSGNGLALAVDAYAPFWQDPGINRTYGYNLYVASNTTAAILDTPFPTLINHLQARLDLGEYMQISATVNATVSENDNLSSSEQEEFFQNLDGNKWRSNVINMGFELESQLMVCICYPVPLQATKLTSFRRKTRTSARYFSLFGILKAGPLTPPLKGTCKAVVFVRAYGISHPPTLHLSMLGSLIQLMISSPYTN